MIKRIKAAIKRRIPPPWLTFRHVLWLYPGDPIRVLVFLLKGWSNNSISFGERLRLIKRLYRITFNLDCPHTQSQILAVLEAIFSTSQGCIVEAGCFKGGSTAKFSIGAKMTNKRLVVFDSFQGIPDNEESHDKSIFGKHVGPFQPGSYCGALDEVQQNVQRFGEIAACEFVEGWFEDTLPGFAEKIGVIYLDVDLVSSTRTCLKFLYPLLIPGGILFSQDGHLPLVVEAFDDDAFWEHEVGCKKPPIQGLGTSALLKLVKPE
ncbi:MAG TPA: methyltransferase [Chloroflexi bacterium]|nr:methyltransferase [Chloroflexota bacterium]